MKDPSDQKEAAKGPLDKVKDSRVALEAQDLFWSTLSGTNRHSVFQICLHSIGFFAVSVLAFFWLGGNGVYAVCSTLSEMDITATCSKILTAPTLLFIPSMLILLIGSFFSIKKSQGRKFQASALQAVLVLAGWLAFLNYLGIGGQLRVFVLICVFFSVYLGYKFTFCTLFNTQH